MIELLEGCYHMVCRYFSPCLFELTPHNNFLF
jgi:hypothetical protein